MQTCLSSLVVFPNDTPPPFPASPSPAGVDQANQPRLPVLAGFPVRLPPWTQRPDAPSKWLPGLASALSPALGSLHPCLVHLTFPLSRDWPDGTETPKAFLQALQPDLVTGSWSGLDVVARCRRGPMLCFIGSSHLPPNWPHEPPGPRQSVGIFRLHKHVPGTASPLYSLPETQARSSTVSSLFCRLLPSSSRYLQVQLPTTRASLIILKLSASAAVFDSGNARQR